MRKPRVERSYRKRGKGKRVKKKTCAACGYHGEAEEFSRFTDNCCWACCNHAFDGVPSIKQAIPGGSR